MGMANSITVLTICFLAFLSGGPAIGFQGAEHDAKDLKAIEEEVGGLIVELRQITIETGLATRRYYNGEREESREQREKYFECLAKGESLKWQIVDRVISLARRIENPSDEQKKMIYVAARICAEASRFDALYQIASRMIKLDPKTGAWRQMYAMAVMNTNRFEEASQYVQQEPAIVSDLPDKFQDAYRDLPTLLAAAADERARDEAHASGPARPRVLFKTNKGEFVVELFEDEAPETVANFVSLVEKGFYDGLKFFMVRKDSRSQTGSPANNGDGHAGYTIRDESGREDRRHHLTYVLTMARSDVPDSASSQFFILNRPMLELDGVHTAFGRILSGFDAFEQLAATVATDEDGNEVVIPGTIPDTIISATVLNKRDHEYRPTVAREILQR
jgi:cyclophilin family peptidyl-prolyl cis-trans isomerase